MALRGGSSCKNLRAAGYVATPLVSNSSCKTWSDVFFTVVNGLFCFLAVIIHKLNTKLSKQLSYFVTIVIISNFCYFNLKIFIIWLLTQ